MDRAGLTPDGKVWCQGGKLRFGPNVVMLPGQGIWGGQQPPLYYTIGALLDDYRDLGVNRLVALRGDMPSGMGGAQLVYANDPVALPLPTSLTVTVIDPDGLSDSATITIVVLDSAFIKAGEQAQEDILDGHLMAILAAAEAGVHGGQGHDNRRNRQ